LRALRARIRHGRQSNACLASNVTGRPATAPVTAGEWNRLAVITCFAHPPRDPSRAPVSALRQSPALGIARSDVRRAFREA
jgi:hypothetical protein